MSETTQQSGVEIAKILPTLTNMPQVLQTNELRAQKAEIAVNALIANIQPVLPDQPGGVLTEDQDKQVLDTIGKLNAQLEKMNGERSPFTQMMTAIAKKFTAAEGVIPGLVAKLQPFRDARAKWIIAENKRKEEEARQKRIKDEERAHIVESIMLKIGECLAGKTYSRKMELNQAFDSMTLDDIDARGQKLREMIMVFPSHKLSEILIYSLPAGRYHTAEEVKVIEAEVRAGYDFDGFYSRYTDEMNVFKMGLVDRIPSKKIALQEAKRLADEQERIRQEQAAAAERQRKLEEQQRQARNAAEAERLAKAAEEERQRQEVLRQQQLQREEEQRQQREAEAARKAEEARQAELARQDQERRAAEAAELAKSASVAQSMFEESSTANVKEAEGETRKGYDITVKEAAGWAQIHQFWFMNQAAALWSKKPEDFEKMTYGKMKTFAEDIAKKTGEKIESPYIVYTETIKAVNRQKKS